MRTPTVSLLEVRCLLVVVGLAVLPGCYLSHERALPPPEPCMAPDAGDVPDGAVLPREPEPEVGMDERPSGLWRDLAPPAPGAVALVAVGEPVVLEQFDTETSSVPPPTLAWNGCGFGGVWGTHFAALDVTGALVGDVIPIPTLGSPRRRGRTPSGLAFAGGRYAVAATLAHAGDDALVVGTLDRRGALDFERTPDPPGESTWEGSMQSVDVARLASAHAWVVVGSRHGTSGETTVTALALDDDMQPLSDLVTWGAHAFAGTPVRVVGAGSRALAIWSTADAVMAQSLSAPALTLDGPPFEVMPLLRGASLSFDVGLFRDRVVMVMTNYSEMHVASIDPWTHEATAVVLPGPLPSTADEAPGLAIAPDLGFVVACWGTVRLQAIGADGTPWGAALELDVDAASELDCAWNGTDVVVVWSGHGPTRGAQSIFSQRVHPTFL